MITHEKNPYAPPKAGAIGIERHLDEPDLAWCDRKTLVVRKGAELPDRCIKCNEPAQGHRFSRNLHYVKPIWIAVFVLSPPLYILFYPVVSAEGKVTAGICPRHRRSRTQAIALGWLTALAGFGAFFVAGTLPPEFLWAAILVELALLIGGVLGVVFASRWLTPTKIDKNFIWLARVSPEYLAEFRDWNA